MNGLSLASVLVASVVGSVHCAAMCGGFVAAYAGASEGDSRRGGALGHVAYNGGRLVTYLVLGALAGAVGQALDLAGRAVGLAHVAAIVAGGVLLASGIVALVPRRQLIELGARKRTGVGSLLGRVLVRFRAAPPVARAAVLGLSSTLLPCGWLYAFVAIAAASGSVLGGVLSMGAFWLGTVPMLLGLGVSLETLGRRFARVFGRIRPALVIGVGTITLLSRLQLPAFAATTSQHGGDQARPPTTTDCPCHRR